MAAPIDRLLSSLDGVDKKIEELWSAEAESRLDAYEKGALRSYLLEEVLSKYK